ncbi:Fe-S cluster assembly protein SufD [Sodalis-like secondary symbiont of Drepanosiphum platanoidis]|uniref:Fe-S cluster assembly protein SufD n=1 Tax=Sodalis-like secondary symbiont of Drepanosiphum platanoidis TaxID=2994493 RepID=UPI003463999F
MEILLNHKSRIISQWYKIFSKSDIIRSSKSLNNWKILKNLWKLYNKNEDWKYISLNNFFKHNFIMPFLKKINFKQINNLSIKENVYKLVFVDGIFIPYLSDTYTGLWNIQVKKENDLLILPEPIKPELFLYITESLSNEIIYITLSNNSIEKKPLYLIHFNNGSNSKSNLYTSHYRHHFEINNQSNGTIIEHFIGLDNKKYFNGSRTTISVKNNSIINHIILLQGSLNSYNFFNNDIFIEKKSLVKSNVFTLNSGLNFFTKNININKNKSNFFMNTLSLLSNKDKFNINTYLQHNSYNCISRQLHKIIAFNKSIGLFNGLIKINKKSINTNASMINNNFIVDSKANINSKPQLEIYNDDVQCKHGSTFGNINKKQIFYLRSRGINNINAKNMMIQAFAYEVISKIDEKIITQYITSYIHNFLLGV